jgi:rhodanese-related sulfurtransferase
MVATAIVLGVLFNLVRPAGIPFMGDWTPRAITKLHDGDLEVIHLDDAFGLYAQRKALFIDAREPGAFTGGHIPSSVNIPPGAAAEHLDEIRTMLKTGKKVISYCHDVDCPLSAELVRKLMELGVNSVKVMPEGWMGWMDKGYPYE